MNVHNEAAGQKRNEALETVARQPRDSLSDLSSAPVPPRPARCHRPTALGGVSGSEP